MSIGFPLHFSLAAFNGCLCYGLYKLTAQIPTEIAIGWNIDAFFYLQYRDVRQEIMKLSVDVAVVCLWRKLLSTENGKLVFYSDLFLKM